jgi:hypothetical protein
VDEEDEDEPEVGDVRDRIVSTVFWTAVVIVGSCFARVSESVRSDERVPVCDRVGGNRDLALMKLFECDREVGDSP